MLEVVQFVDNNKYGLQNTWTGVIIDKEWRTAWGARRALKKRDRSLRKTLRQLTKGKVWYS